MFSYNDFFTLKEEKLKLERENIRLKNEIHQLTEIKEQILPMKTYLIEKYKEQDQEKYGKSTSLEPLIATIPNKTSIKNQNEANEKNNLLLQQNHILKEEILSLKTQFKQKEDEYSQKIKQDALEIINLNTMLLKYSTQNSPKCQIDTNEITKMNDQLNSTIRVLSEKYKTLKYKSKTKIKELIQQNKEKEAEIQLLKEKVVQIKNKFQSYQEEEMNNHFEKLYIKSQNLLDIKETQIQSLKEEILKLQSKQTTHNLNENDKSIQQDQILNTSKHHDFANLKNEIQNESLHEIKSDSIPINDDHKQKTVELNCQKETSEPKIASNYLQNQSPHQNNIKNLNKRTNLNNKEKELKIKDNQNQSNNKKTQPNQNLSKKSNANKTQIKNLQDTIKMKNDDIENKEKLISKLELINNINQEKINRMEKEIVSLSKQLEIYQKNNEQICEFIQSYKKQNLELVKIAFDNIQKSNHSLKNEICSILLDLSEKIEDNEKKNIFIDELMARLNKKENQTENCSKNDNNKEFKNENNSE